MYLQCLFKALGDGADPMIFALYREMLGSLAMYILVYISKLEIKVDRQDFRLFLFLGFCSFCNVMGGVYALEFMSATNYAILQPFIPIVTTIISVLAKFEGLNVYKILGIIIAVTGAVLIIVLGAEEENNENDDEDQKNTLVGIIITLCSQVMFGCLLVFQKTLLVKYEPKVLTFVYYSIGGGITFFMCICSASRFKESDMYLNNDTLSWLALSYAAVFATFVVYNAYAWVNRVLVSSVVSIYSTLQAVFTALLEFMIDGEILTIAQIFGGLMVAIGCFFVTKGRLVESTQSESARPSDMKKDDDGTSDDNMLGIDENVKKYSISSFGDLNSSTNTISGVALYNPLIGTLGRIDRNDSNKNDDTESMDNSTNNHSTLTI